MSHISAGRYITVDADVKLGDAVNLVRRLAPTLVVVHDEASRAAPGNEDRYFVFDAEELIRMRMRRWLSVRNALLRGAAQPAPVFDLTRDRVRAPRLDTLTVARRPLIFGRRAARARTPAPTVLVEDGLVSGVLAPGTPFASSGGRRAVEARSGDVIAAAEGTGDLVAANGGGGGGADAGGGDAGGGGGDGGGRGGDGGGSPLAAFGVAVEYDRTVVVDTTLSLLIRLTRDSNAADTIPVAALAGDVIDVFVSAGAGFVVDGPPDGELRVTEDPEPLPIQIKLRATELGPGRVTIYAFRRGAALGALTISPEIVAEGTPTGPQTRAARALVDRPPADTDLELVIYEQHDASGRHQLEFRLTARDPELGLNLKQFGPRPLEGGPGAYFSEVFAEIEQLPIETSRLRALADERLQAIGASLFQELVPEDLQVLLWALQERVATVFIQSDEPWVPWEICRLVGEKDGRIVEGPFFCEAFDMTRWRLGQGRLTKRLTMNKVGLIVPSDSGLPQAASEAAMVHGLASGQRAVADIPATYPDVRQAFADGVYDAFHFVGHGAFPDYTKPEKAVINLLGNQTLKPTDLAGDAGNLGLKKPLVFFNACQAGRQSMSLTGVGGWANALICAGAGAFVGAHWEVTDELAAEFAKQFYEGLVGGLPIARATREARVAIRDRDPTWLAYTVFSDPMAAVA